MKTAGVLQLTSRWSWVASRGASQFTSQIGNPACSTMDPRITSKKKSTDARLLVALSHPMTVTQLARRLDRHPDSVSRSVVRLANRRILRCLNPRAQRSRVYGLTINGISQRRAADPEQNYAAPKIDYALFGWLCHRHRRAVLLALDRPLQPADMKRRARLRDDRLRISSNNVRDIVPLLLARGVVRPVRVRKRVHFQYELTEVGRQLREFMIRAEAGR